MILSKAIPKFLIPWSQLEWPVEWDEFFECEGPLVAEIGFGNGAFLLEKARQQPGTRFLGVEKAWSSVKRLFSKLESEGLQNVRVLEGDADFLLGHIFRHESLHQVYINFPDPWPKERHHRRRLIQPDFIPLLTDRLVPEGEVTIATDQPDYAAWIQSVLENQAYLNSCFETSSVSELSGRTPTKYERKARDEGIPIHFFVWKRSTNPNLEEAADKVGTMPNMILEGEFERESLLEGFSGKVLQESNLGIEVIVKLQEVYGQLRDGHRLVTTLVKEGDFQQVFGILVVFRENGSLLIKLSSMGHVRPTWGVKRAVAALGEVILSENPGLNIKSSTVSEDAL